MKNLIYLLLLLPFISVAQITDNFNDGNFSNNPEWSGDISKFIVNNNYQLQSYGVDADTSVLTIPINLNGVTEWDIWIKLSFSPSDNNNLRVYLLSDNQDLKSPLNGYFIKIGETGSDDSIDLYRQDSLSISKIIDGISGNVSQSSNSLNLKVTRDEQNNWEIYSDIYQSGIFSDEGSCIDSTYNTGEYFGIFCKYTSSNSTKFYFDDLYIGDIIIDSIPPKVNSHLLTELMEINLIFTEAINPLIAQEVSNYFIPQLNSNPQEIEIISPSELILRFTQELQPQINYSMHITEIEDLCENQIIDTIIEFSFFIIEKNDLIINEIMADPYPPIDLPETEYIEIYNSSGRDININNCFIQIGTTTKQIPEVCILKDSFIVICNSTNENDFAEDITTIGITGFPSLINSGAKINLITNNDSIINSVDYTTNWYNDPIKENGGWSLEKIDPQNNCSKDNNWIASINQTGGSPGKINSVFKYNPDTIQPIIEYVRIIDSTTIEIFFSEELKSVDAINKSSYIIHEFGSHPITAFSDDNRLVNLCFANTFQQETEYNISIIALTDLCDNLISDTTIAMVYYIGNTWDIIINEIMYDPSPRIELPESDFVEIVNTALYPVYLGGSKLNISGKEIPFPSETISPGEFIVLCPQGNSVLFGPFIRTMDILGSNDLTNVGKELAITDKYGLIISSVSYSPNWHESEYKSDGGWSLERIDYTNFCEGELNWGSSNNISGGTPGQSNSISIINPDNNNPYPQRALYIDTNRVRILFSEQMDSISLMNIANYFVSNGIGNPISIDPVELLFNSVNLSFAKPFNENVIYTLETNNTFDCAGNNNSENIIYFGIPQLAEPFDIVINEVLFNPLNDGVDFVEIYNRSNKIIDLQELLLTTKSDYSDDFESIKIISDNGYLIFPGDFIVLTSSSEKVSDQYYYNDPRKIISPNIQLPTMANSYGRIILMTKQEIIIDDFTYDEEMHFSLLNSLEGVTLERINYNYPTNDNMNWHSAAETYGFGTPGMKNSQYSDEITDNSIINIVPEVFSPDNDGIDDILSVKYKFDAPGNVGTITIFDSKGRKVRNLIQNSLLSTEEILIWDGTNEYGERLGIGIYIILFDYFNLSGIRKKVKKTCVLARNLN